MRERWAGGNEERREHLERMGNPPTPLWGPRRGVEFSVLFTEYIIGK